MPIVEWILNVALCLSVLAATGKFFAWLEQRDWWNQTMIHGTAVFVMCLRFLPRHPWLWYLPAAIFAWGVVVVLRRSRMGWPAKGLVACAVTWLWFESLFWQVLSFVMYFCAGCVFP